MQGLLQKLNLGRRLRRSDDCAAVVAERRREAPDVLSFRLEACDGDLPPFAPGAHLDVDLGNGLIRPYSICSDPDDASHYRIAVLRVSRRHESRRLTAGSRRSDRSPRPRAELA
jgi:ferredoxin-NADP reductase